MASTTPNIGLTLPTGAEKVSRQIINDNNTKIDTAIGTLNSKIGLQSGTNNIGGVICAGYNTGSGNYCDAFIPINTNGKTVTSVSADDSSCIFLGASRIDFSSAPTISVLGQTDFGVRVEISYPSAKTSNVCATVYLVALKIVCS